MRTIPAHEACESYGLRYAIIIDKSGMTSVYGMYSSKRAARRIAATLTNEFGRAATVEVARLAKE